MKDGKYVILCIDDDPDVLVSLRIVLESRDYTVVTAPDAREGLQAFKSSKPDAVIVDLMMEEIDAGTKLVRGIQDLDKTVPVYMLSSTGDYLQGTVDISGLGLAGVFQKPVNSNVLLGLLDTKLKKAAH
jgi:two-component system, chemotaxis family, chemotaxis protein CheY